uniref:Uncharacterized protein n=1 Tax=Noctiluca scintillans TaxID=2966 RepID=A0A7S0ZRK8_NOCSC|mmetsp:Transcript_15781/g.43044  ORF Transcript_15781/g.43044 Transcript_15781/m.43044 type:complete len:180 (+) Transcript_15781:56-595(+)
MDSSGIRHYEATAEPGDMAAGRLTRSLRNMGPLPGYAGHWGTTPSAALPWQTAPSRSSDVPTRPVPVSVRAASRCVLRGNAPRLDFQHSYGPEESSASVQLMLDNTSCLVDRTPRRRSQDPRVRVSYNPGEPIPSSKQQMIVAGAPSICQKMDVLRREESRRAARRAVRENDQLNAIRR